MIREDYHPLKLFNPQLCSNVILFRAFKDFISAHGVQIKTHISKHLLNTVALSVYDAPQSLEASTAINDYLRSLSPRSQNNQNPFISAQENVESSTGTQSHEDVQVQKQNNDDKNNQSNPAPQIPPPLRNIPKHSSGSIIRSRLISQTRTSLRFQENRTPIQSPEIRIKATVVITPRQINMTLSEVVEIIFQAMYKLRDTWKTGLRIQKDYFRVP